jgi:hypothetical protein
MGSIPVSGTMIVIFNKIIKDKYLRVVGGLSLFILLVSTLIFYVGEDSMTSPLTIHFDAYKGINFLGSKIQVYGIIISALVMVLINLFLAGFIYRRERFLSYIFGFASLELSILILIVIGVIISVN